MYRHAIVAIAVTSFCFRVQSEMLEDIEADSGAEEDSGPILKTQTPENWTKKMVSASQPVALICGLQGSSHGDSDIAWFYKACGTGTMKRPCDPVKDIGGQQICHGAEDDICPVKLIVEKPKPGLYRCYKTGQKTGYTMTATLINTYQIEIIERKLEPEFLEVPEEVDAFEGSSALFQCRVRSQLPLHVKWYKQVNRSPTAIQYESKFYQGMNGSSTIKQGDISVSKLKFKKLALEDTGTYACGAVNEAGIQYREAKLIVAPVTTSAPPKAPVGHWKMTLVGGAVGFLLLLVTSFCCVHLAKSSCGCKKTARPSSLREPSMKGRHNRPLPNKMWTPEPETSDYEHVVTL